MFRYGTTQAFLIHCQGSADPRTIWIRNTWHLKQSHGVVPTRLFSIQISSHEALRRGILSTLNLVMSSCGSWLRQVRYNLHKTLRTLRTVLPF
jgi:hypothetical protein